MNAAASHEPRAWTARFWWTVLFLILAAHIGLLFALSSKKGRPVRTVTQVPVLQLVDARDEMVVLTDPTLFALPHTNDFAYAMWNQPRVIPPPTNHWTAPPNWLPLASDQLGRVMGRFLTTNQFAAWTPDFKPAPQFSATAVRLTWAVPQQSTFHVRGELARRPLLTPITLNSWPAADVIAPSKVQVEVDSEGRVISAVLLPADSGYETATRDDNADQQALAIARAARFAPAPQLTVGQIIFNWTTVAVTSQPGTNTILTPP